jgi:hypothetical protein
LRALYGMGVVLLSGVALLFAVGIILGEATDQWFFGGAMVGALLITYSFIILLLRRMGFIGPRKTER